MQVLWFFPRHNHVRVKMAALFLAPYVALVVVLVAWQRRRLLAWFVALYLRLGARRAAFACLVFMLLLLALLHILRSRMYA